MELCYPDDGHDQVRISGIAEVVTGPPLLQAIRDENPLLRGYLGTIDNLELIVYRAVPERVRFMRKWALVYHELPMEQRGRDDDSLAPDGRL